MLGKCLFIHRHPKFFTNFSICSLSLSLLLTLLYFSISCIFKIIFFLWGNLCVRGFFFFSILFYFVWQMILRCLRGSHATKIYKIKYWNGKLNNTQRIYWESSHTHTHIPTYEILKSLVKIICSRENEI